MLQFHFMLGITPKGRRRKKCFGGFMCFTGWYTKWLTFECINSCCQMFSQASKSSACEGGAAMDTRHFQGY